MKKINGNCKAVRCLTDGKFYHSVKDAAEANGVRCSSMSYAIKKGTPCKGKEYSFEFKTEMNMMKMAANLDEFRTKALAYDKLMAQQKAEEERLEKIRKLKEEHELKITKAKEKVARYEDECKRREAKLQVAVGALMRAEMELEALMDAREAE